MESIMELLGGNWCNGTSASYKMRRIEYPASTQEYLKVVSVISSCTAIKQLSVCYNMIEAIERKHQCQYDSLRTMVEIKLNVLVGEYV